MLRARVGSPERDTSDDQSDPGSRGRLEITYPHDEPQNPEVYCDSHSDEGSQPQTGDGDSDQDSRSSVHDPPAMIDFHPGTVHDDMWAVQPLPDVILEAFGVGEYEVTDYAALPPP